MCSNWNEQFLFIRLEDFSDFERTPDKEIVDDNETLLSIIFRSRNFLPSFNLTIEFQWQVFSRSQSALHFVECHRHRLATERCFRKRFVTLRRLQTYSTINLLNFGHRSIFSASLFSLSIYFPCLRLRRHRFRDLACSLSRWHSKKKRTWNRFWSLFGCFILPFETLSYFYGIRHVHMRALCVSKPTEC